jgi:hypothetical protein
LSQELVSDTNRLGGALLPEEDGPELYAKGWCDSPDDFDKVAEEVKPTKKPRAKRKVK